LEGKITTERGRIEVREKIFTLPEKAYWIAGETYLEREILNIQ
jgi:hypothetical protein